MKYRLITLFGVVTIVALALAGIMSESEAIRLATLAVLAINGLGFVAGMLITHTLRFPRDGSYRYEAFLEKVEDEPISIE